MAIAVLDHRNPKVASAIVSLQRESYAVEAALIGSDRMPPLVEDQASVTRLEMTILGRTQGEDLMGLVGYARTDMVVDIDRLAVHPRYFRAGIGRSLMEAVHDRESDATTFTVSTGQDNHPAISLYHALGYADLTVEARSGVRILQLVRTQ